MQGFDVPVVLIIFRRKDTVLRIIDVLKRVRPSTVYLLSDEGRNEEEKSQVAEARESIEKAIDWNCNVIKHYAQENLGVLRNIGIGAKWVFEREDRAIFLEDDNLPTESFFYYCRRMLDLYENDQRIMWVCGTNYLAPSQCEGYGYDIFFSQHMLPCGWASWSTKYIKNYDAFLEGLNSSDLVDRFFSSYVDKRLANEQFYHVAQTKYYIENNLPRASWDYQMLFSVRSKGLYGVVPVMNQIRNIGVDAISEHGGSNLNLTMTSRFCELPTYEMAEQIKVPAEIVTPFERELDAVLLPPKRDRAKRAVGSLVKKVLGINPHASLTRTLRGFHG